MIRKKARDHKMIRRKKQETISDLEKKPETRK